MTRQNTLQKTDATEGDNLRQIVPQKNITTAISPNDAIIKTVDKHAKVKPQLDIEVSRVQDKVMNDSMIAKRKQDAIKKTMKSRER